MKAVRHEILARSDRVEPGACGADGKQYVVLAAGGRGSLGATPGDSVLAYTLE